MKKLNGNVLIITEMDKTHFPSYLAHSLSDLGFNVKYNLDFLQNSNAILNPLYDNQIKDYDFVFLINGIAKIFDLSHLKKEHNIIQVFYEGYQTPYLLIPKKLKLVIAHENLFEILAYTNPYLTKKLLLLNKFSLGLVQPYCLKTTFIENENTNNKNINFRYNGNLMKPETKIIGNWQYVKNRKIVSLNKSFPELTIPKHNVKESYQEWKRKMELTKFSLHFSEWFGVGQGVLDSIQSKCIVIEYPKSKYSKEFGLINCNDYNYGKIGNCILANSLKEIIKKYKFFKQEYDNENWKNSVLKNSLKILKKHHYKKMNVKLYSIMKKLME